MDITTMEILTPYRITKESSDGTFEEGDIIWKSENGDINSMNGTGWIIPEEEEPETLDFTCEDAEEYEVIKLRHEEVCRNRNWKRE